MAEAALQDKTVAGAEGVASELETTQTIRRRMNLKKRLILLGGGAAVLLLVVVIVAGVMWKLRSRQDAPPPEPEKPAASQEKQQRSGPLDVRPPLPDIRPRLHLLPPDQVYHAPAGQEPPKAEVAAVPEARPAPVEMAKPAAVPMPESSPAVADRLAVEKPRVADKPVEKVEPAKPVQAEKPVEKAPEAPVSIFVTRKEKKAVGDCTVEAKKGANQKELRTQGLAECIRLFNETDRPAGK